MIINKVQTALSNQQCETDKDVFSPHLIMITLGKGWV